MFSNNSELVRQILKHTRTAQQDVRIFKGSEVFKDTSLKTIKTLTLNSRSALDWKSLHNAYDNVAN